MTDAREKLAGLSDNATSGPWHCDQDQREGMEWNVHVMSSEVDRVCFMSNTGNGDSEANADLIVALVNAYRAGELVPTAAIEAAVLAEREACALVCTAIIKDYDVMKPDGKTYEPMRVQKIAKGMVSLAREDIRARTTDQEGTE